MKYLSIPNCNDCTVEVWDWISNFIPHLGLELICVSKGGSWGDFMCSHMRVYWYSYNKICSAGKSLTQKDTHKERRIDRYPWCSAGVQMYKTGIHGSHPCRRKVAFAQEICGCPPKSLRQHCSHPVDSDKRAALKIMGTPYQGLNK